MTQTPNPPAGWYPQDGQERWWDGTAWSDNIRPAGSGQVPYGQPFLGQPQYGLAQPPEKSNLARNILIVFGVIFLLFVGGCVALVAVVGSQVNDAVNDDTPGGPNNPLTIVEGQPFEVDGFEYAAGWDIVDAPLGGLLEIQNLQVTNHRGEADRLFATITLLDGGTVVATASCVGGDLEKIAEDTTVTVECSSADELPTAYDQITIKDSI